MNKLDEFFYISVSPDQMLAEIHCKDTYKKIKDVLLNVTLIIEFLKKHRIVYGVEKKGIELLLDYLSADKFPITIARGEKPQDGQDGEIIFKKRYKEEEIFAGESKDFRDIIQIPTVQKGEKLASIISPTKGQQGKNVYGKTINSRPGKGAVLKPGKGVNYRENDQSFYADIEGQVNISGQIIQVHPIYEVSDTLSMEVGNLDFVGSIVIKGDVPTGYTVKAGGDVRVQGIVEGATIIAGGSIYISEGLSGLKKGYLKANESIHIGYINQGTAKAGQTIDVKNAITHSDCSATEQILCRNGNIIGGSMYAGQAIKAGDIGNRLSTKTMLRLGPDDKINNENKKLIIEKKELTETLRKLKILGEMLTSDHKKQDTKIKMTLLRQKHSIQNIEERIHQLDLQLKETDLSNKQATGLIICKKLYSNVIISFGKYERRISAVRKNVCIELDRSDIVIKKTRVN